MCIHICCTRRGRHRPHFRGLLTTQLVPSPPPPNCTPIRSLPGLRRGVRQRFVHFLATGFWRCVGVSTRQGGTLGGAPQRIKHPRDRDNADEGVRCEEAGFESIGVSVMSPKGEGSEQRLGNLGLLEKKTYSPIFLTLNPLPPPTKPLRASLQLEGTPPPQGWVDGTISQQPSSSPLPPIDGFSCPAQRSAGQ